MTNEQLKETFDRYRSHLDRIWPDIQPCQSHKRDQSVIADLWFYEHRVSHYKFMCEHAKVLIDDKQREKAMRWLGFLQGALWREGRYSLDELKYHVTNPSDPIQQS
jgi:hypothetical protein